MARRRPPLAWALIAAVAVVVLATVLVGLVARPSSPGPTAVGPTAVGPTAAGPTVARPTATRASTAPGLTRTGVATARPTASRPLSSAPAPTASTSLASASPGAAIDPDSGLPTIRRATLPREARETLSLIDAGGPFPYPQDGSTYRNLERVLPSRASGYYHEYTVLTPGSPDRGARRIVTGRPGESYWTTDHYASFRRIVP